MIRIEDNFEDVLGKAMTGQGLSRGDLAARAGLETARVESLLQGRMHDESLQAAASVLGLSPQKLLDLAHARWTPETETPEDVCLFNTPFPISGYEEMTVNSYLIWSGSCAAAIDTGANADALLHEVRSRGLNLKALYITHAHRDHIAALDAIRAAHPNTCIYAPEAEPVAGDEVLKPGSKTTLGSLTIEARGTSGHSPGALSYVVENGVAPLVFSGDALFCLSMGKAPPGEYSAALERNRRELLSLPDSTILCPGHGPVSTIGQERLRNPFF